MGTKKHMRSVRKKIRDLSKLEQLALRGESLSLAEIAQRMDLPRQSVHNLLRAYDFHGEWKKRREDTLAEQQRIREVQLQKREEERVQKNQLLQVLSALIIGRCQQTAMQRGEAGLLLLKYIAQKPRTGYSEQQLMLMFTRYCSYRDAGIPASIYRIGRESQMGPVGVSDVLKTLKLPTLCYGKRWQPTAAQQMAMRRGIRLGLPARDLVYFLRIPWYQAKAMRRQNGIARPVHDFTYRDLSAVYEAQDAGYGLSEISQLVRANTHRVQNVLQRRSALEPKVVQMLRDLYADSTISQPYVERRQASLASRAA